MTLLHDLADRLRAGDTLLGTWLFVNDRAGQVLTDARAAVGGARGQALGVSG